MEDPTIEAELGDILYAKNNININGIRSHFIIYLGSCPERHDLFLGAMLTHSPGGSNVSLKPSHFKMYDDKKKAFRVIYDESFIASDLYYKKMEWRPFAKKGELTEEGLTFIMNKIGSKSPIFSPLNNDY